jgi:hypothetical protein
MASVTTVAQLDGLFKEVYADKIENLIPESGRLLNEIKFSDKSMVGKQYHQPVRLTNEQGITYAGPDAGAFDLNSPIAMTTKDAIVDPSQVVIRSQIPYDAAFKAIQGGRKAFVSATGLVVEGMMDSITKRLIISLLYGGTQIGIGTTISSTNTNATTTVVQITDASWATGIWTGSEDARIQFFTGATQVSSGADGIFTISSIDLDNKTLTVTGTATGITALDDELSGSGTGTKIYWETMNGDGTTSNDMAGIDKIITNTGTLFNISASAFNLWKGNVFDNSNNALTIGRTINALSSPINRGLDEDATMLCSPTTWANLNVELAGNRRFDGSFRRSRGDNGFETIEYFTQNGKINIIGWNIVKEGEAFIIPFRRTLRGGATDITFRNPGKGGEFFRELESKAGFELRAYYNQAAFIETPAKTLKITNIVNATS